MIRNKVAILLWSLFLGVLLVGLPAHAQAPTSFEKAKLLLRQHVYYDREQSELGDFYCGCKWQFHKRNASGGKTELAACGYQVRAQATRANRIEWEHIVPAHSLGQQRQCWQNGGRKNCVKNDPEFARMEADMHNLTVAVGEVNADRSNYRFSVLPSTPLQHGQCEVKIDFTQRAAEPRDAVKGMIARTYFYMHDRYNLPMSRQQQQLFQAWHTYFPVSDWERERNRRIARIMGVSNEYVTGEKVWGKPERLHKTATVVTERATQHAATSVRETPSTNEFKMQPSNQGGFSLYPRAGGAGQEKMAARPVDIHVEHPIHIAPIYGNEHAMIYHLPACPSYHRVSAENKVIFLKESHAIDAGYRKADNCPR